MNTIAYILIALALIDISLSTKKIVSIVKSNNPKKKEILRDNYKLVINLTLAYIGNFLVIVYCIVNLFGRKWNIVL